MLESNRKYSRRELLRGFNHPIRPPWALNENDFIHFCQRCDACIRACELNLIQNGSGGFPEMRFDQAGCDFCGECLKACTYQALRSNWPAPALAWSHRAVLSESRCLSMQGIVCRSCGDHCDAEAIQFKLALGGKAIPIIDAQICNGCGECLSTCSNQAIQLEKK